MMSKIFILLVLLFTASDRFLSAQSLFEFPKKISDWIADGEQRKYAGDDLFKLIDGGADIFYEYGFEEVITQQYASQNNIMSVEAYRMKNPEAAYGIFSLKTMTTGNKIKVGDDASMGTDFIMLRKGNYFFALTVYEHNEESQKDLMLVAEYLSSIINVNYKLPDLCRILSTEEFPHRSIVYIKGNMCLYNLYLFDTQNIFGVKEGVAGNYNSVMNFIFKYSTIEECTKWFDNATAIMKKNAKYKMIKSGKQEMFFRKGEESIFITSADNYIAVSVSESDSEAKNSVQRILGIINNQK